MLKLVIYINVSITSWTLLHWLYNDYSLTYINFLETFPNPNYSLYFLNMFSNCLDNGDFLSPKKDESPQYGGVNRFMSPQY